MSSISPLMEKVLHKSINDIFDDVYMKWGGDVRIDADIAREIQVPVFAGVRLQALIKKVNVLMERQEDLPLDNIWRVEVRENSRVKLDDFTMPSQSPIIRKNIALKDAPKFIQDGLSVLQIAPDGASIEGVGKRISDTVYYLVENVNGENARGEG